MSSFKFDAQEPRSLRHHVSNEIRKAIFNGSLKPGDRLREQDISDQMHISRGPIREAFSLLEREGLVVTYPYKETVVADLEVDELIHVLLPIRWTLESFAVKQTLSNLTQEDLASVENIVRTMELCADTKDLSGLVEQDINFHRFFIRRCDSRSVVSLWDSIDMRIRLHFASHGREYQDLHEIPREHRELLEAFQSGHVQRALHALRHHILELNDVADTEDM